jgi:FkbM family methyltransferase
VSRISQSYVVRRSRVALANLLPDKPVRRRIQGVEMVLPRAHALPFYALDDSPYGQNLVSLARGIGAAEGRVVFLDVGANVGDSTAQVLDAVDGHAVCIEPDPRWLPYLEQNVAGRADIESALLLTAASAAHLAPDHYKPGTTRYVETDAANAAASITVAELAERHPVLADVRLVKSDTDGYDVDLVPAIARTFAASRPVLFFEFHPGLTRAATPSVEPDGVWQLLHDLGYEQAAVWHNYGYPLGAAATADLPSYTHVLDEQGDASSDYWDVGVAHKDDPTGLAVLAELMPQPLAKGITGAH